MTEAQIDALTSVLQRLAEQQGAQLATLQQFLTILSQLHAELAQYDITPKDRSEICARIRTALSLDNPQLWHDALVSTLAVLGLPKGG